jgi:hypothetical protein
MLINVAPMTLIELYFPGVDEEQEDVFAGCPPELFSLTSLKRLNLSFQGLVSLSSEVEKLSNLEELILSHNPLLESLPGALSQLLYLKGLFAFSIIVVWLNSFQSFSILIVQVELT